MSWYFVFFFISGFCAVLYELVWLRLAMAQFGVTTAMVSIVLSVFMAGMGLGSWASGRWLRRRETRQDLPALRFYALIELLIGVSGIVVPYELLAGRQVLAHVGVTSSLAYYVAAGLWVAGTLVPWCGLMGATIPVAMRAIGQRFPREAARSFSYLYTANVAGALVGTALPLVLIELWGFHGTLRAGVVCNATIAVLASLIATSGAKAPVDGRLDRSAEALRHPAAEAATGRAAGAARLKPCSDTKRDADPKKERDAEPYAGRSSDGVGRLDRSAEALRCRSEAVGGLLGLLFLTGMSSMGMEVVWVRQFTPYLGTVVYAFAAILAVYLAATFLGSQFYRRWGAGSTGEGPWLWMALALAALLPLVMSSPFIDTLREVRLLVGIMPFTGLLGFVTPMLVDRFSGGSPSRAGTAYAINVVGCIVGPLLAGFVLLPWVSERWALVALTAPWLLLSLRLQLRGGLSVGRLATAAAMVLIAVALIVKGRGYQDQYADSLLLRDSTATVIATGTGMDKQLLVNGYGMTTLTSATKMMAHIPLALLDRSPQDALDICFGMGTTFRSLMSWKVHVTAVELVPSVPRAFGYFHSDGPELLKSPLAHVVIDDGRRYLERTNEQFDLITIDPPPPVEAAGSSLLYSEEFYARARQRLRPGGIVAQWLPNGNPEVISSVAHALKDSFPNVRVLRYSDDWGYYFFASDHPLPKRSAEELVARMPADAVVDLTEWFEPTGKRPAGVEAIDDIVKSEIAIESMIAESPTTPALRDDRPVNEYYALRQVREH